MCNKRNYFKNIKTLCNIPFMQNTIILLKHILYELRYSYKYYYDFFPIKK
jgi:hypothetical protein